MPDCKKAKYTRHGWRRGRHRKRQRGAGASYADGGSGGNLGFECRQAPRLYVPLSLVLSGILFGLCQEPARNFGPRIPSLELTAARIWAI